jgi:hypothetical protein
MQKKFCWIVMIAICVWSQTYSESRAWVTKAQIKNFAVSGRDNATMTCIQGTFSSCSQAGAPAVADSTYQQDCWNSCNDGCENSPMVEDGVEIYKNCNSYLSPNCTVVPQPDGATCWALVSLDCCCTCHWEGGGEDGECAPM